MNEFSGRVAVILGACTPLGSAMARRCIQEGMKVVLADADAVALDLLSTQLQVLAVRIDIDRLESLAQQVLQRFGGIHLLVNATRLEAGGAAWETSWDDWERVLRVNLWGSIQLVKVFTPLMLAQGGHILTLCQPLPHPSAAYEVSQSALLALFENLSVALQIGKSPLKASVLCMTPNGPGTQELVDQVFRGIRRQQFYLLPDPILKGWQIERRERILQPTDQAATMDWRDRVAVITGAASGIGRGLVERCLSQGMKVVLADISEDDLHRTRAELDASRILCVPTDVSQRSQVEALAQAALTRFGAIHFVANNAGVGAGTTPWESSWNDWEWVMGVNLWGVIHGVKIFVPLMLEQKVPCHLVNTASAAALLAYHPSCCYQVSKNAVLALSEHLHRGLSPIQVSVLCPGNVNTQILDSARNRPPSLQDPPQPLRRHVRLLRAALQRGMSACEVADHVFLALGRQRFYILTHSDMLPAISERMEDMLHEHNPRNSTRLRQLDK